MVTLGSIAWKHEKGFVGAIGVLWLHGCVHFMKCTQFCRVLSHISMTPDSKEMLLKLQVSEMNQMFTENLWPDGDFGNSIAVFAY